MKYRVTIAKCDPNKESEYDRWHDIFVQEVPDLDIGAVVDVVNEVNKVSTIPPVILSPINEDE